MISRTITIDPDVTISQLKEAWLSDDKHNEESVILALSADHAGLAAVFLAEGLAAGWLKKTDLFTIANRLSDLRVSLIP